MLDFQTTVRKRQSIRAFLPDSVPQEIIDEVLKDARAAPSSCNTQPWNVHVVSGETLKKLSEVMIGKLDKGEFSQEIHFNQMDFTGKYEERWRHQYKFVFDGFNVAREGKEGRKWMTRRNFEFYGARHAAFLFVPKVPNNEAAVVGDMAMYAQNMMLSFTARGYGSIPQFALGLFAAEVKEVLGVPDDYSLYIGISFGVPDWDAQPNREHLGRAPMDEIVTFHR